MKSFTRFIKEDTRSDEQVRAIRNAIVALISSGALDAFIKSDLIKEEIHTYSAEHDETRYRRRLQALRSGLVAVSGSLLGLLKQDTQLDDDLLRKHGITKWDRTDATHAAHVAKRHTLQRDRAKSGAR